MLCRRSDILWSLDAAEADDVGVNVREALAKAPRPVLHLLRSCELAKVDAQQREEVYEHNEASAEGFSRCLFESRADYLVYFFCGVEPCWYDVIWRGSILTCFGASLCFPGSDFELLNFELCYSTKPFPIPRDQFVYTVHPPVWIVWTPRMRSSVVWVRRSFMSLSASAVETKNSQVAPNCESLKRKLAVCRGL